MDDSWAQAIEDRKRRLKSMQRSDDQYNYFEVMVMGKGRVDRCQELWSVTLTWEFRRCVDQ